MLDVALAARLTGRPHLWHIKEWVGRQARTRYIILPDPLLVRFFIALSDRVLIMSRFIGEVFQRYGFVDRVVVVNEGVDHNKFTGCLNGRELRHRLGISDEELLIGMVASLSSTWKRHALYIEMASVLARRFPNVRFAIFGPEPNRHVNSAYNQAWDYYQA